MLYSISTINFLFLAIVPLLVLSLVLITLQIFPKKSFNPFKSRSYYFQVILENMLKTKQFYEFILVDIDFVEITHNQDVNNLVFPKIKNSKGFNLSRAESKPLHLKRFSQNISKEFSNLVLKQLMAIFFFNK